MSSIDWLVLCCTLTFIVGYGIYKGRGNKNIEGYLLAGKELPWYHVLLSMMATQASAITFLSLPGQAYGDGMRFVQFYFGLPLAMIVLCTTFFPAYQKLRVFTAYEFIEQRFDLKTRKLTAFLFLLQRGISTGISIYAPSIVLSAILKVDIRVTTVIIGLLVIIYTTYGGSKAVSYTQLLQMGIITGTLLFTGILLIIKIKEHVSFGEAMHIAGVQGRMNIINFKFDWNDRYNVWSGIIGGFFLQLSYFGTDHSQVSRYLTSKTVRGGRMGLLLNGLIKIPMQFSILFIGVLVFVFFHFVTPPLLFNEQLPEKITTVESKKEYSILEQKNTELSELKKSYIISHELNKLESINASLTENKNAAITLIKKENKSADTSDSNYIFLWFVTHELPTGLIGLLIAVIFMASMGSLSSGLNSLASSTVVDIYKRSIHQTASDTTYLNVSRYATLGWGLFCIGAALAAGRLGNLIEVVNIMGSLFYGTILGIFIVAFYVKYVKGNAVFYAAVITELFVVAAWYYEIMAFLWLNVLGCLLVVIIASLLEKIQRNNLKI
ncbi:MAG: sodium:solute symporter [Bacteroidota bacterium]